MHDGWPEYVPVAERLKRARKAMAGLQKTGQIIRPVTIAGRKITTTFWGDAWCTNLERYSHYANRLPKGRTYVRNGSVVDLQVGTGLITARVMGSDLYTTTIRIVPLAAAPWSAICRDCAGSIDSLVELLQGRLAKGVMERVCRRTDGLFPAPGEIRLSCSCLDGADLCKHVAAALYGVGARLDAEPALLFTLRGVDSRQLAGSAAVGASLAGTAPRRETMLAEDDVSALFGLEMADDPPGTAPPPLPTPARTPKKVAVPDPAVKPKPSKDGTGWAKGPNRASSRDQRAPAKDLKAPVKTVRTHPGPAIMIAKRKARASP